MAEVFMRVLLVEDHTSLRELISDHLCERGFAVDAVSGAEDALVSIAAISYDAAIIDLGLPDMGGLELLTRMRAGTEDSVPTLVITARDSLSDRVRGLNGSSPTRPTAKAASSIQIYSYAGPTRF